MNDSTPAVSFSDKRGFSPQDPALTRRLMALATVNTAFGIGACLMDWMIMLGAAFGSWVMFSKQGVTLYSIAVYAIAAFVIATRQQGLKNLIHEASHYNLSRNRPLNDFLCRLATYPIHPFLDLEEQRKVHVRSHHARFLNPNDNVFRGYEDLKIDVLPLASKRKGFAVLVQGLLRYWYWQIAGAPRILKRISLLFWLGLAGMSSVLFALIPEATLLIFAALLLYWFIPLIFILPPLSFVVLIAEHLSTEGVTEFERSRNKLGFFQRVLLHPHGDSYHMLHHLYPGIPHHHLGRAHRLLMTDPIYRNGNHCYGLFFGRRSVLRAILNGPSSAHRQPPLNTNRELGAPRAGTVPGL